MRNSTKSPIDQVLYDGAEVVAPWFHKQGLSPNDVTTMSFVSGILSLFELSKGRFFNFAALYTLSYAFDCLDGFIARRYKLTSTFGDLYDHVTDVLVHVGLLFVLWKYYKPQITASMVLIYMGFMVLTATHLGCQQRNCAPSNKTESLDNLKFLCPNKRAIKRTRWFGTGSFNLVVLLLVWSIVHK